MFIDAKIHADHSGMAVYYRIDERDLLQQVVELALTCKDCLVELTEFSLACLDRDLSITSEKLTTALKVLIFHCFVVCSLYLFLPTNTCSSLFADFGSIFIDVYILYVFPSFFFLMFNLPIFLIHFLSLCWGDMMLVQSSIILLVIIGSVANRQLTLQVFMIIMETTD